MTWRPFLSQVISGGGTPENLASNWAVLPSTTSVLVMGWLKLGGWVLDSIEGASASLSSPTTSDNIYMYIKLWVFFIQSKWNRALRKFTDLELWVESRMWFHRLCFGPHSGSCHCLQGRPPGYSGCECHRVTTPFWSTWKAWSVGCFCTNSRWELQ